MEHKSKALKKKKSPSLRSILSNRKYRYLFLFLCMLPFIVMIAVFGSIAMKEIKSIKDLADGSKVETKAENIIESMNYILRDNPTDLQKEYFAQLKSAVENGEVDGIPADNSMIAELVAKNYIADFYTWTNKRGQYDIGGMYYIYDGEFENGNHYKNNVFVKARDGFYKYISVYAKQYGNDNLIEVADVTTSCSKMSSKYVISEHDSYKQDENEEWYDYRVNNAYDAYLVKCNWTYKENDKLPLSQFAKSINLAIINRNGRFEIVEASEKTINARQGTEQTNSTIETEEENAETSTVE